ncbi:hypothetical protein GCM10009554_43110 [Kribbella koreensis]|uniref:DNA primase DNAG catalytic core N-terminal domain-containing protein n=1 Tax=Kribbella koreensis TaxID=57909 RepID=A0ABN1QSQ5_9ACTN
MNDAEAGRISLDERQRLHEANALAAIFFRQELLGTEKTWPVALLESWGAGLVLSPGSAWQIGLAPDGGTRLVDRLRAAGFGRELLLRSGLASSAEDGRLVDRYRDQLVVVSHDRRLDPVGFVGIDREGRARPISAETPVHRRAEALVGVMEQIDLLGEGAIPVIVDHPLDAVAVGLGSHEGGRRHVGIPLCGAPISKDQASILRRYTATNWVIVTVPFEQESGQRALRSAVDLTEYFDRVRMLECPPGPLVGNPWRLEFLADLYLNPPGADRSGDLAQHLDPEIDHGSDGPGLVP